MYSLSLQVQLYARAISIIIGEESESAGPDQDDAAQSYICRDFVRIDARSLQHAPQATPEFGLFGPGLAEGKVCLKQCTIPKNYFWIFQNSSFSGLFWSLKNDDPKFEDPQQNAKIK